jgi:colanic acid biosynthesis glycosyl transferase WcaI
MGDNRLSVLFLTPYYPPEVGAPQARIYELALRLQQKGHQVSVLTTFPNYPSGVVPKEWRGQLFWKGEDHGIKVYRTWSYATPNKGFYKRILGQLSFVVSSCLAGLFLPRVDAIIVESPPLFDGFAGVFLSTFKRAPYILNVADLWLDAAVQMGMLRNPRLIRLARQVESYFYRRSAIVFAVTSGVRRDIVDSGILEQKVILFRNAVDTEFFTPLPPQPDVRRELGAKDGDLLVMYAGTLGMAQQVDAIVDAAALFHQDGNSAVQFVFLGDGSEKDNLSRKAQDLGLNNVRFLGVHPKSRMPALLGAADCVLVSVRDLKVLESALPTKMFEAMACCKPVVLAARGEAAEALAEARAGVSAQPGDPVSIHDAILRLQQQPEQRREMGQNGRLYVLAHFSRDQRAGQLSQILDTLHSCQIVGAGETDLLPAKTTAERERSNRVAGETRNY